ncbi:MAG: signal peptidase I [Nitrospira sp.]|nr:signal peptidase I [Nitrospira sp.]
MRSLQRSTMLTLAFTISMHAATVLVPEAYGRTDTVTAMPGRVSEVFHELARRDLASGALMNALDNSVEVADLSTMLQMKAGLANTLTALELKRIKQSMMKALKCMLVDLAPPGFLETRLATHYESSFSRNDAQQIIDSYHDVRDRPEKARLHTARLIFWEKARKDLATEARSWSQSFHIPSGAMLPTLVQGDHILVNKRSYSDTAPQRGDVIVFRYPEDESKLFVKRIVGLPGDLVELRDQSMYLNGVPFPETYIQHTDNNILADNPRDNLHAATVPPNAYFVLGDNRESSLDSRFWGYVAKDKVLGKAESIYFSIDRPSLTIRWERLDLPVR